MTSPLSTAPSVRYSQAPWKDAFLADVQSMEGQEFAFSSLHQRRHSGTSSAPRSRFCTFRCFWTELSTNPLNPAKRNPNAFKSELPVFTTDARTSKIEDLFEADEDPELSGGGGACEAVWWARGSLTQWRVRGQAFVIGPDIESNHSGAKSVRSSIATRMHRIDSKAEVEWSWAKELTAIFGDLSPTKRGRYVAPPPGQPVNIPFDHIELGVGREVHDLDDFVARKHFRAIVVVPQEVEALEMRDPETARRHLYRYVAATSNWVYEECWP